MTEPAPTHGESLAALIGPSGPKPARLVQTLGSAIRHAHSMVAESERRRAELINLAFDRGATTREVAALLGVAPSTVWRWAGGRRRKGSALEAPLYPAEGRS